MKLPLCYSGSMKATKTSILLFFIIIAACIAGTLLLTDDDAAPLLKVGVITACSIVVSFFFSVLTGDYSWTDRLWSTLPVALAWGVCMVRRSECSLGHCITSHHALGCKTYLQLRTPRRLYR